jgi:hypothetical protein
VKPPSNTNEPTSHPHDGPEGDELALLAQLGATTRAQDDALDPRLDALCDGTISAEDRAALEADAAKDPALGLALEAFRPLGDDHAARIAAKLVAARPATVAAASEVAHEPAPRASNVVSIARRRPSLLARSVPIVGALAVAAAAVVYFVRPSASPLPPYELIVGGGDRALRGGDADPVAVPRLARDSRFELLLRPASATSEPIEVRAFLVRDGIARPWQVTAEVSADGAARIQGRVDALFPAGPGEWGVLLVVGRRGHVELDAASAARLYGGAAPEGALQLARARVQLDP